MKKPAVINPVRLPHSTIALSVMVSAVLALSACGGSNSSSADAPAPATTQEPPETGTGTQLEGPEPEAEPAPAAASAPLPTAVTEAVPAPPVSQQVAAGADASNPSVAVKPVLVTSSSALGGNTAAKAIDGSQDTRWESAHQNDAWIQFDFGAKTKLGYMKLAWYNSYGKEYTLQVSDDGQTWYQLRYVVAGQGGVEEFFNLNANVRYVRLKGIVAGTQYGYSLVEVEFKSTGSDNTLGGTVAASFIPSPAAGDKLSPQPAVKDPLEVLQFSLPDGTLVTRWGMRAGGRHGRERGEAWNEVGYGPNDTMDAAGKPLDKGPGSLLTFVKNYFKNRTWGVEFIDNSKVAGVTKPRLIVNEYYQEAQRGGGHGFVRGFTNPNVTGFGWTRPGEILDRDAYTQGGQGIAACPSMPKPPQNALLKPTTGYNGVIGANGGCSLIFDSYPGYKALVADANGVLVGTGDKVSDRPLKAGDYFEFTNSFFSTRADMDAIGDSGAFRYYSMELTYVMGEGLRPWYGVQPRLMNAPLPAETLQGGLGSVSYDYSDDNVRMFQQPHNNIGMQNMQRFVEGRRWFHTSMQTGEHNENGNDRNDDAIGLQGPRFNQATCFGCHINNGRGLAPIAINQRVDTMAVRVAEPDASGRQLPHPMYGAAVQMNARPPANGTKTDWGTSVRVAGFDVKTVKLADGTTVELSKPKVAFDGPTPGVYSLRSAQPVIGMGLLESIPDSEILSRVRTTPDADGVKGQANYAYDPESGAVRLGRYGWKASKVSLRHQVAGAALLDLSVTSPIYPNRDCLFGPAKCSAGKVERGLSNDVLQSLTRYVALLGVPAQRSLASGFPKGVSPTSALAVDPVKVKAGAKVFADIKCSTCHVTEMKTGSGNELAEVRNQTIKPYTDLLLHDMGPDLADTLVEGQATGGMWRTSALWGIGYTEKVAGDSIKVGYLHDSRARTLTEAVMWHGGEAATSRQRFGALSKADRDAVLAFLNSL